MAAYCAEILHRAAHHVQPEATEIEWLLGFPHDHQHVSSQLRRVFHPTGFGVNCIRIVLHARGHLLAKVTEQKNHAEADKHSLDVLS